MFALLLAARLLVVDLVRGSVHVTTADRADVAIVAHRSARNSNPEEMEVITESSADRMEVYIHYPTYLQNVSECLPPLDRRGDFFHHDGRVDLEVTVPIGWTVNVSILEENSR